MTTYGGDYAFVVWHSWRWPGGHCPWAKEPAHKTCLRLWEQEFYYRHGHTRGPLQISEIDANRAWQGTWSRRMSLDGLVNENRQMAGEPVLSLDLPHLYDPYWRIHLDTANWVMPGDYEASG